MESTKKLRLPLTRVKKISKLEPNVSNVSHDAAYLLALATEKYIELLSKSAWNWSLANSRKTMHLSDIECCIRRDWMFAILEDALSDWPMDNKEAIEQNDENDPPPPMESAVTEETDQNELMNSDEETVIMPNTKKSPENSDEEDDADLQIDRIDFRKTQFDVFKHEFIESFDGDEKAEHLLLDIKLKKDVINMIRRLDKAKAALEIFEIGKAESVDLKQISKKISEILEELKGIYKDSSEFSSQNIKLPEYNQTDMELLLGGEENGNEKAADAIVDPLEWLRKTNEMKADKIVELLGAGEIMLNEWNEVKNYIKIKL